MKDAGRQISGGIVDELQIFVFNLGADRKILGRDQDVLSRTGTLRVAGLEILVNHRTDKGANRQGDESDHEEPITVHCFSSKTLVAKIRPANRHPRPTAQTRPAVVAQARETFSWASCPNTGQSFYAKSCGRTCKPLHRRTYRYPCYCAIELATEENTLFAFPPISRIVPTTMTRITASMTAYSAMSWPSSPRQSFRRMSFISNLLRV